MNKLPDFPASPAHDSIPFAGGAAPVSVRMTARGWAVYAERAFRRGELVLAVTGRIVPAQAIHTIQIALDTHFEPDLPARYLNHSCDPNLGVHTNARGIPDFYAFHAIAPGEELTFDYAMTEYTIVASDVVCCCGAANCRGHLGSYRDLPEDVRRRYAGFVADYLLKLP